MWEAWFLWAAWGRNRVQGSCQCGDGKMEVVGRPSSLQSVSGNALGSSVLCLIHQELARLNSASVGVENPLHRVPQWRGALIREWHPHPYNRAIRRGSGVTLSQRMESCVARNALRGQWVAQRGGENERWPDLHFFFASVWNTGVFGGIRVSPTP